MMLTTSVRSAIIINVARMTYAKIKYAAMAQSAEHVLGKDEVTSSNLVSSSKISFLGSI